MGGFKSYKKEVMEGNIVGVKNNFTENYLNIIVDEKWKQRSIHISCSHGDLEIAKLLISKNCEIECEDINKCKPIHLACKNGHVEIVKLLMKSKCNIESETNNQDRPIHLACRNEHFDIVKLLIEHKCQIEIEDANKFRPIHLACKNGHFDIAKLLIKHRCNIESETINKYRPIHLASKNGYLDIVKLLMENKCEIEKETIKQNRPIHLACMKGHLEIVKILTKNRCQIHCVNKFGHTPTNIANEKGHKLIVEYLNEINPIKKIFDSIKINDENTFSELSNYRSLSLREYETGLTVLDVALQHKADKIVKHIMNSKINDPEFLHLKKAKKYGPNFVPNLLVLECILYRCIRDHYQAGFQWSCSARVINGSHKLVQSSFLEIAAQYGSCSFINEILKKSIYNQEEWGKAKTTALQRGHLQIVKYINNREGLLRSREKANFSILHTAICDNDANMVKYILDSNLVDPDINNEVFGTGLALAHSMCYKKCITTMEKYNINSNTKNKYMQTPLHEAIASGMNEHCEYLINQALNVDETGYMGFTPLHCAVLRKLPDVCEHLVEKEADCSRFIQLPANFSPDKTISNWVLPLSTSENALTLCLKRHGLMYPCFVKVLKKTNVNIVDGNDNSLLHLAVQCLESDLCQTIIKAGGIIEKKNKSKNTALLELFSDDHLEAVDDKLDKVLSTLNVLIDFGSDVNVMGTKDRSVFHSASRFNKEIIMTTLIKKSPKLIKFDKEDLKLAFTKQWFNFIEKLIPLINYSTESLSSFITEDVMQSVMSLGGINSIKCIFINANAEIQQQFIEDLLCKLTLIDDIDTFEWMINTKIFVPKIFENGENLFTNLLHEKMIKFSYNLLISENKRNFLNLKNTEQETPLEIAIEIEAMQIVERILSEFNSADLKTNEKYGNLPLTLLFKKMSNGNQKMQTKLIKAFKLLIEKGGNFYKELKEVPKIINECPQPIQEELKQYFK